MRHGSADGFAHSLCSFLAVCPTIGLRVSGCGQSAQILILSSVQFGLFHGDPHPGNIFALRDGRIGYVDFGNVAELSQRNKQTLIDAVVHAVNEDYKGMADDFVQLVSTSQ